MLKELYIHFDASGNLIAWDGLHFWEEQKTAFTDRSHNKIEVYHSRKNKKYVGLMHACQHY